MSIAAGSLKDPKLTKKEIKSKIKEIETFLKRLSPLTSQLVQIGNELNSIGLDYACSDGSNWRNFRHPQSELVKYAGMVLYTQPNYYDEKYLEIEKLLESYVEILKKEGTK
jgi:hypothetical protein